MRQVLHIFRKDVRHFWIEILVSILALSAYIWKVLHQWGHPEAASDFPNSVQNVLMALGPISWCLLVVRAVQDESLVGDRQFWVTRPYDWKRLLAAKGLFVLLFVNVPLLTANVIFVKASGFSPMRYLAGLLGNQLSIIAVLVLPVAAISVVTSTFVQVILWTLGIGAYAAGVASLSSLIPDSHIPTSWDNSDLISMGLFAALLLAIVLWQYMRRRPWIARATIVGLAVVTAIGDLMPTTETQVARAYPLLAAETQQPFHVTSIPPKPSTSEESQTDGKQVKLSVPVRFAGVSANSLVVVAGTLVAIRTRNGDQLTTRWVNDGWDIWPGEDEESVPLELDRSFFESSRFVPADLRITFAFTEYHEVGTRQIVTAAGEFPIEGIGICWLNSRSEFWFDDITCRSPLRAPQVLARFDTAMSTCRLRPDKAGAPPTTRYASDLNDDPGELAIIPIQSLGLRFSRPGGVDDNIVLPGVCPGTVITLSTPGVTQHASVNLEIKGADLRDYLPSPINGRLRPGQVGISN